MKRVVQSARTASDYQNSAFITHGPNIKYHVYWNDKPFEFSISKSAGAYVEGDFCYAKYHGGKWCIIYDGETYQPIDRITIPLWDMKSEDYEDYNEYVNDVFDRVILNLEEYNKDVSSYVSNW